MIDLSKEAIELKSAGITKGIRPVFVKILKSAEHQFKGNYLITADQDILRFYQLKWSYRYKFRKPINFYVNIKDITGFHFSYYKKDYYKKIMFYFKSGTLLEVIFPVGSEEAYDNEPNANSLMNYLKDKGVKKQNLIVEGGKNAQRTISKTDQWFTQEIRSPQKRKGFFG